MDLPLQHLRVFYEVARCASVSGAARRLRITQPSLSRSVIALETALNRQLFLRKPRGVVLTSDGSSVFERCQVIFRECEAIGSLDRRTFPRFRIAASENLCLHVLPRILGSLENRSGSIVPDSIELSSGTAEEITRAVMTDGSDVGYCYHAARIPGLSCEPIAEVPFVVVASQGLVKKRRPSISDLERLPFIGSRIQDYRGPNTARNLLSQSGVNTKDVRYESNSQEAQVAMAAAGLGFTVVPWFVASPWLARGDLIRIPTQKPLVATLFRISARGTPVGGYQEQLEKSVITAVQQTTKTRESAGPRSRLAPSGRPEPR